MDKRGGRTRKMTQPLHAWLCQGQEQGLQGHPHWCLSLYWARIKSRFSWLFAAFWTHSCLVEQDLASRPFLSLGSSHTMLHTGHGDVDCTGNKDPSDCHRCQLLQHCSASRTGRGSLSIWPENPTVWSLHTRAGPSFPCSMALCPGTRSHLSHCCLPCSADGKAWDQTHWNKNLLAPQ